MRHFSQTFYHRLSQSISNTYLIRLSKTTVLFFFTYIVTKHQTTIKQHNKKINYKTISKQLGFDLIVISLVLFWFQIKHHLDQLCSKRGDNACNVCNFCMGNGHVVSAKLRDFNLSLNSFLWVSQFFGNYAAYFLLQIIYIKRSVNE